MDSGLKKSLLVLLVAVIIFAVSLASRWDELIVKPEKRAGDKLEETMSEDERMVAEAKKAIAEAVAAARQQWAEKHQGQTLSPTQIVQEEHAAMQGLAAALRAADQAVAYEQQQDSVLAAAARWGVLVREKQQYDPKELIAIKQEALAEAGKEAMEALHLAQGSMGAKPDGQVLLLLVKMTLEEAGGVQDRTERPTLGQMLAKPRRAEGGEGFDPGYLPDFSKESKAEVAGEETQDGVDN